MQYSTWLLTRAEGENNLGLADMFPREALPRPLPEPELPNGDPDSRYLLEPLQ